MELSRFAHNLAVTSGIGRLRDDLAAALEGPEETLMLGGSNPAHIPAAEQCFRDHLLTLAQDERACTKALGDYDSPQGNSAFIESLCELLQGCIISSVLNGHWS
ncbi:hypothetical protein ACFL6U_16690 [Planctomycetota bacterium]